MAAAPRLQVEHFSIEIGRRRIVDDLAFAIAADSVVALVGESGSGKSLTALGLLGLLPPAARARGAARFYGGDGAPTVDLLQAGESVLRGLRGDQIAWVPQESLAALDPRQTIGAQLREALGNCRGWGRGESRRQMLAMLAELGLADPERCLASYPFQLSGGERQRVLIAMALLPRPRLLIADEPTTALDVSVQARVLHYLRAAHALLDCAMLFITHDLGVAAALADWIVVLRAGRLVEAGPTGPLLSQPVQEYTRALLAAVPTLPVRRLPAAGGAGAEMGS